MHASNRAWPAASGDAKRSVRSQGTKLAAIAGFVNELPPSVDFAQATPLSCVWPWLGLNENCRHATNTVPFLVTATSQNWLPCTPSEIFCTLKLRAWSVEVAR